MIALLCLRFHHAVKRQAMKKLSYLNLIQPPMGITHPISESEKQKVYQLLMQINAEITKKLQQLQNTGLSRQQILLSKSQKGLPLIIDPFFQFIKRNLRARQIYLKKNDRFSVDNVVNIALRQDIGPDPSYARVRDNGRIQSKNRAENLTDLHETDQSSFNPKSYYSGQQFSIDKAYEQLKPHQPLKHIYKPIDKYERRKMNQRKLKFYDIHWRNVELLRQFTNNNGAIKNRGNNMLSVTDQRRVVKAIKTARNMAVLPFVGRIPEPLKRNITTLEDDVKELGFQHVNLQTGHVYFTRPRSQDSRQLQIEKKNDLDSKYHRMTTEGPNYRLWVEMIEAPQEESQQMLSESYAHYRKKLANEQLPKGKSRREEAEALLKTVTGLRVAQEMDLKVEPREDEECKEAFEEMKDKLLREFAESSPQGIAEKLLADKIKL